jgi:preprotein translocase subunit YajC
MSLMRKSKLLYIVAILAVATAAAAVARAQGDAAEVERKGGTQTPAAPTEVKKDTTGGEKATDQSETGEKEKEKGGGGIFGNMWLLWLMLGGFFLLYIWMGRGKRKQQQQRQQMLSGLKKGDKVTSIGGIVGTVMEVRDDEIMVKVDESANVRMRFAKWAVRGVGEIAKAENPAQAARQQQQSQRK